MGQLSAVLASPIGYSLPKDALLWLSLYAMPSLEAFCQLLAQHPHSSSFFLVVGHIC